ncbi:MAG: oligoendopeptidase F [Oscillospiraceae bacterium]|jgi:oligoendopeptidase F|nr:oligoendopeptidase F [Oscillospiraceae bacterium]
MELARRKDVPEELKWDLSLIYPTEAEMEADFAKAQKLADHLAAEYPGTLNDPARIVACLDEQEQMERILVLVGSYCGLAVEVDYYDTANQQRSDRVSTVEAQIASRLSFIESEILQADDAVLDAAIEQAVGCKHRLMDLRRRKPYQLAPETEKALAALQMTFNTPYEVYNMAKLADMQFPSFTVDGKEYPLGYSLFEDDYEYERDTAVRRAAFDAFSAKLRQYENVTASAYNALVRQEKSMADLRGYPSVFDYLLFDQKVTREMYDRQIDLITERLAPHMRRFARLLQKKYGLDEMTFADLKLSLDPDYDPRVTIPEAKDYVKKGLAVMGEDYVSMVEEAFDKRWIDFAKNQGKCTGGFCSSPYGRNSFILLSWNDRMSDVFTIAHELGHAGHFRHCNAKQSLSDTEVSTYLIEAPSTMNELLLAQYLLKTNDDPRFRRWVLSSMISNTYYHNFVTHLREAWYQREVYKLVDAGDSVNAEVLSDIFRKNLELFWGEGVKINDGAELTWMRQPHYYMGLYSYTYSAGLTVATEVARRIQRDGAPAVEDWKKVLDAGSTLDPIGLAKLAGVDITTDAPLNDTIDYIGSIIDEICKLTKEIDGIEA